MPKHYRWTTVQPSKPSCICAVLTMFSLTVLLGSWASVAPAQTFSREIPITVDIELQANDVLTPLGFNFADVIVDIQIEGTGGGNFSIFSQNRSDPMDVVDGDAFAVESFFDVFFDITITDIDPDNDLDPAAVTGTDLITGQEQIVLTNNPSFFLRSGTAIANLSLGNFGLIAQTPDFLWIRDTPIVLGGGSTLTIPTAPLSTTFVDQEKLLGDPLIFTDGFESGDVSVWSRTVNPHEDFEVTLTGTLTVNEEWVNDLSLSVELATFTVTNNPQGVLLRWRTESEINNLGFHVYRSKNKEGEYVRVTPVLIKGHGTDATPHDYTFLDDTAEIGKTYYYYIEDVDLAGNKDKSHIIKVGAPISKGKLTTTWAAIKKR